MPLGRSLSSCGPTLDTKKARRPLGQGEGPLPPVPDAELELILALLDDDTLARLTPAMIENLAEDEQTQTEV